MPYLLRVVLHENLSESEVSQSEYHKLHEALKELDFYNIVQDDVTKKWYHLPPAEYVRYPSMDIDKLHDLVMHKVNSVRYNNSTMLTHYQGARWSDLKELPKYQ